MSADDHTERVEEPSGQVLMISSLDEQAEAQIRRVWHEGRWFFSVIDVIGLLTDSPRPRKYWSDLKVNLASEGSEVSARVGQLKMTAADGKQRLTEPPPTPRRCCASSRAFLRPRPSRSSSGSRGSASSGWRRWRILRVLAADRMRRLYKQRGYSDEWIDQRMQGIVVRDELTTEWRERGAEDGREFPS